MIRGDEIRLTGDPVADINAIGEAFGVARPAPVRVQRVADRSDRARRRVAAALEFIGTGTEARTARRSSAVRPQYRGELRAFYESLSFVERHEAGHVVVAWELGATVDRVTVGRAGSCGETTLSRGVTGVDAMAVLWAGHAAEASHQWWEPEMALMWEGGDDSARFRELADEWEDPDGVGKVACARALRIVADRHRDVDRVAAALEARRTLDRSELELLRKG